MGNKRDDKKPCRLARSLSSKKKDNISVQPSKDMEGKLITSSEQQHEAWALFLEKKFAARPGEPQLDLQLVDENVEDPPEISLDEVKACAKKMKPNKSPGPDTIPAEQIKISDVAISELHLLLYAIWKQEDLCYGNPRTYPSIHH